MNKESWCKFVRYGTRVDNYHRVQQLKNPDLTPSSKKIVGALVTWVDFLVPVTGMISPDIAKAPENQACLLTSALCRDLSIVGVSFLAAISAGSTIGVQLGISGPTYMAAFFMTKFIANGLSELEYQSFKKP